MKSDKMESRLQSLYRNEDPFKLKKLLEEKLNTVSPTMEYVRNLILDLKTFMRILIDEDFNLREDARRDFTSAIIAFLEKKKALPIVGYWDVYKLVRYVKSKHKEEINRYFSQVKHYIANYM